MSLFDSLTANSEAQETDLYTTMGDTVNLNELSDLIQTSGNQNSSTSKLKRIKFRFKDTDFKFTLNPETYTQTENGKVNVTRTKGGAFVEMFGADIPEIDISGTTGFRGLSTDDNKDYGYQKFKKLKEMIKSVWNENTDGSEITDENLLWFYNYTDNEYWKCIPDKFELSRSVSKPLLYRYSIHLYCIREIGQKAPSTEVQTIGNPITVEIINKEDNEA